MLFKQEKVGREVIIQELGKDSKISIQQDHGKQLSNTALCNCRLLIISQEGQRKTLRKSV